MATGFTKPLGKIGHVLTQYKECLKATLAFASNSGGLSVISCGSITGIGTITGYVIEWRLNSITGPIVLLTGYNPDVTVNATHPFVNEPVQSGNLYAVVRYIIIDGIRYSPYFRLGQFSPDLKICFNYVSVSGLNCGNPTRTINTYNIFYGHIFTYNNASDPAVNASRNIKFDLNADGTTRFIAWKFTGYDVVDRITLNYYHANDIDNPIEVSDWEQGTNLPADDWIGNPKKRDYYSSVAIVNDLTVYNFQAGDYLVFTVTPRVYEPTNTNTNWVLEIQCLTSFDDYIPPVGSRTIDPSTVEVTYDTGACKFIYSFKTIQPYIFPDRYRWYMDGRFINAAEMNPNGNYPWYNKVTQRIYVPIPQGIDWITGSYPAMGGCRANAGTMRTIKTGNVITMTFTSSVDYDLYKASYNSVITNGNWTNYTSDVNSYNHYKLMRLMNRNGNTCGDTYTDTHLYLPYNTGFVFDDVNHIITINMVLSVNDRPWVACDNAYNRWNSDVQVMNAYYNLADFDITSSISYTTPFLMQFHYLWDLRQTSKSGSLYYGVMNRALVEITPPTGWHQLWYPWSWGNEFAFQLFCGVVTITDISDGMNNFKIETWLKEDGTYYPSGTPDLVLARISNKETAAATETTDATIIPA
jgi:hypothetical protein